MNKILFVLPFAVMTSCFSGRSGEVPVWNKYHEFEKVRDVIKDSNGNYILKYLFNPLDYSLFCEYSTKYYIFGYCSHYPSHSNLNDQCPSPVIVSISYLFESDTESIFITLNCSHSDGPFQTEIMKAENEYDQTIYNSFAKKEEPFVYKIEEIDNFQLQSTSFDYFSNYSANISDPAQNNCGAIVFSRNFNQEQMEFYKNSIAKILNRNL